jgi:hypothetical protein
MLVRKSLLDYDLKELTLNELKYRYRFLLKYSNDKKELIKILQQMVSQGATDEQIEAFLQEVGITMEELQQAREMFGI